MKRQILKIRFRVHKKNLSSTLKSIENFCNVYKITYTYSVKDRFFPFRSVVNIELDGLDEHVNKIEEYIKLAHKAKTIY